MDDYKQPDMPETSDEVEMLLDEQTVQAEKATQAEQTVQTEQTEPVEPIAQVEQTVQTEQAEPVEQVEQEESTDAMSVNTVSPNELPSDQTSSDEASEQESKDAQLEDIQLPEAHLAEQSITESEQSEQPEQPITDSEQSEQPIAESEQTESLQQADAETESQPNAQFDTQSSVSQSVTLDAIQDSETVKTVNLVKQLLNDLDEAQKDKTRLSSELKQSEKAYSSMEKSVAEGITTALKKKKEEIAATYDRELSQYQDQIDACKTERAKAKANAIAQRIQVETAPLNQQNQQLEAQIELKFKENKVPVVCKKRAISMLFFPKNSHDWAVDILVGVGLLFVVPLLFALTIQNRFVLAFSFFVYVGVLFAAYLYLLHKYMLKFISVNDEVEELRKQIRVNNKNKQLMTNRIKKSQDETGYNLGSFDDKIAGIQQVMQDTVAKRQEALENFESEIRHQITADITAANKDELLELQQAFEDKRKELSDKKDEIEQIEKLLKEEYEPVFGKDLLYKQRLNKFDSFCQENADLSMEDALAQYRALSGSKLLKK